MSEAILHGFNDVMVWGTIMFAVIGSIAAVSQAYTDHMVFGGGIRRKLEKKKRKAAE